MSEYANSPKAMEYLMKYLEIRDYSKALVLANAILTNLPHNELVLEIRKYLLLQINAPDDFEPITEQELEDVEHFDPNSMDYSDSEEEEEEEEDDSEEEDAREKLKDIVPPPQRLNDVTQSKKPKVGKLPSPRQRKPVKKIVKPRVRVTVQNVPIQKKK